MRWRSLINVSLYIHSSLRELTISLGSCFLLSSPLPNAHNPRQTESNSRKRLGFTYSYFHLPMNLKSPQLPRAITPAAQGHLAKSESSYGVFSRFSPRRFSSLDALSITRSAARGPLVFKSYVT